jgi:hypothetical protein
MAALTPCSRRVLTATGALACGQLPHGRRTSFALAACDGLDAIEPFDLPAMAHEAHGR